MKSKGFLEFKPILTTAFFALLTLLSNTAYAKTIVIIVNKSNPLNNISTNELSKILDHRLTTWTDGQKILPVEQTLNSPQQRSLYLLLFKTEAEEISKRNLKSNNQLISFDSEKKIINFIGSIPNSIGYLDLDQLSKYPSENIKVLTVDGYLPSDKGYNLQYENY